MKHGVLTHTLLKALGLSIQPGPVPEGMYHKFMGDYFTVDPELVDEKLSKYIRAVLQEETTIRRQDAVEVHATAAKMAERSRWEALLPQIEVNARMELLKHMLWHLDNPPKPTPGIPQMHSHQMGSGGADFEAHSLKKWLQELYIGKCWCGWPNEEEEDDDGA